MEKMGMLLQRLVKEEKGMETVEYAVVGGLVLIVGVLIWNILGNNVSTKISELASMVSG